MALKSVRRPNQYLKQRGDVWHYVRRVPKAVQHVDRRTLIYRSLETDSRKLARQRRDHCAAADEARWNEIALGRFGSSPADAVFKEAQSRAESLGFQYRPVQSLLEDDSIEELVRRVLAIGPP